jgi:ribosome biogenesis GTPase / thiamine phosphate phosphatase
LKNTNNKELARLLEGLDRNEVRSLYKKAAMLRKARPGPRRQSRAYSDDDEGTVLVRSRRTESLDDVVLRLLTEHAASGGSSQLANCRRGTVVQVAKRMCTVSADGEELQCLLSGDIARTQQTTIAVGDELILGLAPDTDDYSVQSVLPRRTQLSRPDPDNAHLERVIVANVDQIGIVVSLKTPPLHPRIIDRYLVAIRRGGAEPLLVVNKVDLATPEERAAELAKVEPYRAAGVRMVECSSASGEGIDHLRDVLGGKVNAFVGHSGVGKSSLLNALMPSLELAANEVSAGYGRGTHTTTASTLYDLGGGTRIIDTPGIRSFGLSKMAPGELQWYFPEFEQWAGGCRFRDCTHSHEPDCRVREAAETGLLSKDRRI